MNGRIKNAVRCLMGEMPDVTVCGVFGGKFHSVVIEDGKIARLYVGPGSATQDVHAFPYAMGSEEFKEHVTLAKREYE